MKINKTAHPLYFLSLAMILLAGCDMPGKPNFTLEQKNELPLLQSKKFYFLGGSDAFIDTTKGKIDTLFSKNSENVVVISFTDSIEIGDLDDAIPAIDVDATSLEAEIGNIEIDDFDASFNTKIGTLTQSPEQISTSEAKMGVFETSLSGSGSSSFNDIIGYNPPNISSLIPAGNTTINIDLNVDKFVSATIESGGLDFTFTNHLGFNLSQVVVQLESDANGNPLNVGTPITFNNLSDNATLSQTLAFQKGDIIKINLRLNVQMTWDAQNYVVNNQNSFDVSISDNHLKVSEANAEIPSQSLNPIITDLSIESSGFVSALLTNDNDNFNKNTLVVTLKNKSLLPLTNSALNDFPVLTMKNSDGDILDSPKSLIPVNPSGNAILHDETVTVMFNLAGQKLTKNITYILDLGTSGSDNNQTTAISSTDAITIDASTTELELENGQLALSPQSNIKLSDEAIINGDFTKAVIDQGILNLTFTNDLAIPFTIQTLTFSNKNAFKAKNKNRFIAAGSEIGSLTNIFIPANSQLSESIDLSGKAIGDIILFDAIATSNGSNRQEILISRDDEIKINVIGSVDVNEATSKIKSQSFSINDVISIDNDNIEFEDASHYIKLKSGELVLNNLINDLDVNIDTLKITIPQIKKQDNTPLIIGFYGNSQIGTTFPAIQRKENGSRGDVVVDLSDYSIFAQNNEIAYELYAVTENTENSSEPERTIKSEDKVSANISINNLVVAEVLAKFAKEEVIMGDDDESNGKDILDIKNDLEASIIDNDGLSDISEKLSGLQLSGTNLSIQYTTNLGVKSTVYMVIAGEDNDGNLFYLKGKNQFRVSSNDQMSKFYDGGAQIADSNLIKFSFGENATSPISQYRGSVTFNESNSNIDDFLSKLPVKMRTLGIAVINQEEAPISFVANPIEFNTELSIDMPLSLSTSNGPIEITEDLGKVDVFNDAPEEDDDLSISEMELNLNYKNGFPLALNINFDFLDKDSALVHVDYEPIQVVAASVDANGFASNPTQDKTALIFSNASQLSKVERMSIRVSAETADRKNVKIRTTDFFEISLSAKVISNFKQK